MVTTDLKPTRTTTKTPAARAERAADRQLVERTLALLHAHDRARHASERAIGEHVLDDYFDGDPTLALSKSPAKKKSFALLAARAEPETDWDEARLLRAVKVAMAWRSLGAATRKHLTARQLHRLSSIDDVGVRRKLAARIAKGEVTGDEADAAIAEAGGSERRGGRPAASPALRVARTVERVLDGMDARSVGRGLDGEKRKELAARLREASRRLAQIADRLD